MIKQTILVAICATMIACGQSNTQQPAADQSQTEMQYFGEKINEDSAISVDDLQAAMGDKTEMPVKLVGTVESVCQQKGCWMKLKKADGSSIRITFKDYGFFMPKDCSGKTAIAAGVAKIEETSVADLQEYAKDAGKSETEVAAITTPERELVFEASGVILK